MLTDHRQLFVRQRAAVLKLTGAYDILDPATKQILGSAVETPPSWAKYARLLINKGFLPTAVQVREAGAHQTCLSLEKAPGILTHRVTVRGAAGEPLGYFKTKAFTFRSRLLFHSPEGRPAGELTGDWKGWDFTMKDVNGQEIGKVTKKWAGIGKELFTTADSYMISVSDRVPATGSAITLLLAAGLAVDLALKEHSR